MKKYAVSAIIMSMFLITRLSAQNNSPLKPGKSEMSYYLGTTVSDREFAHLKTELIISGNKATLYSTLHFPASNENWIDTSICNSITLAPIYHSSSNPNYGYLLHYGKEVTGYYLDKKTRKKTIIKDPVQGPFIDEQFFSEFITTLPLTSGYKNSISVYAYSPANASNIKTFAIDEVKNSMYTSPVTGEHKVWQATIMQRGSANTFTFYIDKNTPKVWGAEINANGQSLLLLDKEADYNPIVTKFNKEETLKMMKNGNSIIDGQVFARDNQSGIRGIAILNINKKQFAPTGTSIVLIPYTDFFKEWFNLNDAARKKGKAIPLPKEAAACIKATTVYDNEGHFEFTNLMAGDYILLTQFGYTHTAAQTRITGYTDTYIGGAYAGTSTNTTTYHFDVGADANVKKEVTIKQNGDKVTVKLKKTL